MMSRRSKWITGIAATIMCLALLALAGIWRLGLLTLLFTAPSPSGTAQIAINNSNPAPAVANQQSQQPPKISTGTAIPPSAPGKTAPNSTDNGSNAQPTNDQLQQQIDSYYTARLQSLAESYESQLNSLVSEAYNEYQSDKEQGKDVSVATMGFKYMSEGHALEQQCDSQFYSLLAEYKADLLKNNLSLDTAIKAQQQYESAKAAREKALLSAAAKMI